jgi:hypothetical protein
VKAFRAWLQEELRGADRQAVRPLRAAAAA